MKPSPATTTRGLKSHDSPRSTYLKVRSLLEHVQEQHRCLRETFSSGDGPGGTAGKRTKLVFDYLARREGEIREFLDRFSRSERDSILDTWLQYADLSSFDRKVDEMMEAPPESPREAMSEIALLDHELYRLYERLEDTVSAPSVRDFFRELREITLRRAREHAESLQQVEDI